MRNIRDKVAWRVYQNGLWKPDKPFHKEKEGFVGDVFPKDDVSTIHNTLWRFVGPGILTLRRMDDELNQNFKLSNYGRQVLKENKESPYDPLGFLRR